MKTEYVTAYGEGYEKRAIIYTDQIREDGTIFYGMIEESFVPYFYVDENAQIPYDDRRIVKIEPGYQSIFGDNLLKIYTKMPTDVPGLRDMIGKTYEADILFPWRYRIDKGFVNKINVKFFVDIEVSMGMRFDKESFTHPVTCLTCYDTNSKQYHTFVWRGDFVRIEESLVLLERIAEKVNEHKKMNVVLHKFPNEKEMLSAFCSHFISVNPDVVTSWNTSFDYPYLIQRMYVLQMDPSILSPIHQVGVDKFDGEAIIKGRYVLDLLQAYKKIHIGQLESFKLDDVGLFEFDVPKIKLDGTFDELWKQNVKKLIEYNIADLEICIKLDSKKKVLDFFEGIASFTGVPLDETLANSRILDFYFLREAHKRGLRLPSANKDALPPDFEGAIVKEPVKGLHRNVICLDLASLYPSIILAGNMSLETVDPNGDIKFGNGVCFKSGPPGFITSLIQDFLDRRKKIKKEMLDEFGRNGKTNKYEVLDAQQNVTKFLTNCFSDDTEVLTLEGIKNIKDIKVGDEVYSVNPNTLKTEIKKVTRTYKYRYKDDMYHIHSSDSDFVVTPNHRMFMGGGNAGNKSMKFRFVNAENLFDDYVDNMYSPFRGVDGGCSDNYITLESWMKDDYEVAIKPPIHGNSFIKRLEDDGVRIELLVKANYNRRFSGSTCYVSKFVYVKDHIDYLYSLGCQVYVRCKSYQTYIPYRFNTSDWFELVGYFISEGSTYKSKGVYYGDKYAGVSHIITIVQKRNAMGKILNLIKRMGIIHNIYTGRNDVSRLSFSSEVLFNIFTSEFGIGASNKSIPSWMFEYDKRYLQILLDALWFGDGDKRFSNCGRYSTVSKKLAGDVVRLCVHIGRHARISEEKYDCGLGLIYRVNCRRTHKYGHVIGKTKQGVYNVYEKVEYDGYVYCIEVEDNHTMYAGRNGKFQGVSNSIYGVLGFFRSRYFLEDVAKTITWVGREINLHTQRVVEENGYSVVAGDTDSVYVVLPDGLSLDEIVERGKLLQDKINKSYDKFSEQFGIKDMMFDIKFEKVYSVAVFCKKKRYIGRLKWKEGKTYDEDKHGIIIDVVGFESRRSDTSKFTKSFQKDIFKRVLLENSKHDVFDFVNQKIKEFREVPLDDIAMPKSFTKKFGEYLGGSANSVFINAAKWSNNNLGYDFGGGSKGLFLYTRRPSVPNGVLYMRGDVTKLEKAGIMVDYDLMIEKTIYDKLDTLFEAIGWERDELETGQRQMKLNEWF